MKNFFGLLLVLLGLGFLLQQLNVSWTQNVMVWWWPIAIISVGVFMWNSNKRSWFGPAIVIMVGIAVFTDHFSFVHHSAWNIFWPLVIILFGGRIIFGMSREHQVKQDRGSANASVFMSGIDRTVTGTFDTGSVSAWFGGIKLDLRDALLGEQTTLSVSAGFGGVEILVPKNVRIVTKITPILGGADDKTTPDTGATKTLTITGSTLFGGVSIKN